MTSKAKPFLNLICDHSSWGDLLGIIKEPNRFSMPDKYHQPLIDACGRPILVSEEWADMHIYPPIIYAAPDPVGDREKFAEIVEAFEGFVYHTPDWAGGASVVDERETLKALAAAIRASA